MQIACAPTSCSRSARASSTVKIGWSYTGNQRPSLYTAVRGLNDTTCTEVSRSTWSRANAIMPSLTAMVVTSAAQPIMMPSTESSVRRGWMRSASTPTSRLALNVSRSRIGSPGRTAPSARPENASATSAAGDKG
jgi:hypothetical protein